MDIKRCQKLVKYNVKFYTLFSQYLMFEQNIVLWDHPLKFKGGGGYFFLWLSGFFSLRGEVVLKAESACRIFLCPCYRQNSNLFAGFLFPKTTH